MTESGGLPYNPILEERLLGIHGALMAQYQSNRLMSSASKGLERDTFIHDYLSRALPPAYRFGTGDAIDVWANRSGQLDIVVENPFAPNLASIAGAHTSLYLIEGVAAVIEVKSDLAKQKREAAETARKFAALRLQPTGWRMAAGVMPPSTPPLFAVGYTGWAKVAPLVQWMEENESVFGALILDRGIYSSRRYGFIIENDIPNSLWHFLCDLHWALTSAVSAPHNLYSYFLDTPENDGITPIIVR